MGGQLRFERDAQDARIGRLTLSNPGKLNAVSRAMWGQLRDLARGFDALRGPALRVVILCGEGGNFAAGADIEEFPRFRFEVASLREYHEGLVAPALTALQGSDVPLVAQIEGVCVGAGLEIASCCDIRIAGRDTRYAIPIAKRGFPMAPEELAVVLEVAGRDTMVELLLEAGLWDAETARARGLVQRLADDPAAEALSTARRIAALPASVARANKRTLRQLLRQQVAPVSADEWAAHFDYAGSSAHREGIAAFLDKRAPRFETDDDDL